jgi:hypothetical protein
MKSFYLFAFLLLIACGVTQLCLNEDLHMVFALCECVDMSTLVRTS